ncbi:hypothetical protein [Coleofasciculus sp. FACHB-1120]|uniref:hypothetical protein n=1 Tax=Coleofasciculus sp. FACHB-1120 TaxID=2692783 RepID=UPI001687DE6E|nr:hypothetical protein [Coleofasciculus sp. FACHB-1120]MBD2742135.1 hypothetical protein [Coleofasciculus sp. FACHB-1120]
MSVDFLRLIPTAPQLVPDTAAQQMTLQLFKSFVPQADRVYLRVTDDVEFVDPGSNLEQIFCPVCLSYLETRWWQQAMDTAYCTRFNELMVIVPCCGAVCSLNDLRYECPAGFARFILEARQPNTELDNSQIHLLEQMLGCPLRKIWAHY